jgi:hypothetical protein
MNNEALCNKYDIYIYSKTKDTFIEQSFPIKKKTWLNIIRIKNNI